MQELPITIFTPLSAAFRPLLNFARQDGITAFKLHSTTPIELFNIPQNMGYAYRMDRSTAGFRVVFDGQAKKRGVRRRGSFQVVLAHGSARRL